MAEVKTVKINVDTKGAIKSVDDLTKSTNEASSGMKSAGQSANDVSGNLGKMSPAFGGAINGAKGLLTTFKALVSNPIIATVVAITGALIILFKAFTSTKLGGEQLEQLMSGLGAVIDIVRDRILSAGNAIVKFFSGDFKGALKAAKSAVSGFGAEVRKEFKAAADATKLLQKVDDQTRKLGVSRAKLNRDLAKTKEVLTDENASLKEKTKALDEVRKAEQKQTDAELKNAKKKLDAIKAKNKLSDTSKEDLQKQADAEAALYTLQEQSATNIRSINKQDKLLKKQQASEDKTANTERIAEAKELQKAKEDAIKKIAQAERDYADTLLTEQEREKVAVQRKYKELIAEAEKFGIDTTKLKESETAEKEKIDKKYEDARLKIINEANKKANDLRIQAENDYLAQIEALDEANYQATLSDEQRELQAVNDKYFALETAAQGNAEQLAIIAEAKGREVDAINTKYNQKEIADAAAVEEAKRAIQQKGLDIALQGISVLKGVFEKSKGFQKGALLAESAVGIAKMIISNKSANAAALLTPQAIATGGAAATIPIAFNNIQTGIGIAANIAATTKALKQLGGGTPETPPNTGGGGGGGARGGSQTPNFNVVGNSGVNQLAQLQQQPMQAYVVSGEVTSSQALDRNRIKNATL